ncbi:MAG: transposase family protein [Spiroplasma poulsonii]|nr:transposase family protein [Spiroplasma poulsonii]
MIFKILSLRTTPIGKNKPAKKAKIKKTEIEITKITFKSFEQSAIKIPIKIPILKNTKLIVDSGYQGIQKNHNNVLIPTKKTKKNPLNKEQKQYNRLVSKMRIIIENIFAILKKFKIITEKYRNRRKRFGLRFNLIVSIYNYYI